MGWDCVVIDFCAIHALAPEDQMPVDTGEFSTMRCMASAEVNKWFNGSVVEYTGFYSIRLGAGTCRVGLVS